MAVLLAVFIPAISSADNPSSPSGNIASDSGNDVNNIQEDRHDSPNNPTQVTGIVVKMPVKKAGTTRAASTPPPITYRTGGPVMLSPKVSVLWYGTWTNPCTSPAANSTPAILNHFLTNIGSSPWYGTNTLYYQILNGTKSFVTPTVTMTSCYYDAGTLGKKLDGSNPSTATAIKNNLTKNGVTPDPNTLYFIFTSSDVTVSGFGTSFCGYHGVDNATGMKYSMVGDATNNMSSCTVQSTNSPNNNPAADGMASVVAHELVEAVSDPTIKSWLDSLGNENGDKCAWNFLQTTLTGSGYSNVTVGPVGNTKSYLIQANWNPVSQSCFLSIPQLTTTTAVTSKTLEVNLPITAFTPVVATYGTAPYTYSWVSTAPPGLTLSPTTGAITGTPTASLTSGTVAIKITDAATPAAATSQSSFTLQILAAVALTPSSPITLTKNIKYSNVRAVTATGGQSPYTYSITSGSLPSGITFSTSAGTLSGTATTAKTATTITVKVTDSLNATATTTFSIAVI
jgi:hypothetical protein